jgi:hypothetical protein
MKHFSVFLFAALMCAPAAMAQKWEVGVGVGGAFYNSQTFTSPAGSANASLDRGIVASAWVGNNPRAHFGGELRYDFGRSDLKLSSGGTNATFSAVTHAIHYDILWHFASDESGIRPFVAVGAGVKAFDGTGKEIPNQPLSSIGLLTKTNQIRPLISIGGGVKVRVGSRAQLRLEVHDYLTPFPNKVIAPALGAKGGSGWLMDFVPMVAIAFAF